MTFQLTLILAFGLSACSIRKPCSDGGDVSWIPNVVGDKRCEQKVDPKGRKVNHGSFTQIHESTGKLALEGAFLEGKKDGIWLYYREDGSLSQVKYFEQGVEKTAPLDAQKRIDILIQSKAGTRP